MKRQTHWIWMLGWLIVPNAFALERVTVGVFEDHHRYAVAADSYGLSWELIVAAAAAGNLELEVQELSWKASLERLKANKLDLVFGALYSEDRATWATFSHPLIADSSAIFTSLDNPTSHIEDIDLDNQVVGVTLESVQEVYAREMGFKNIYSAVDRSQLYSMLKQKRIDYLFFGTNIISYYCLFVAEPRRKGCMKQVGPNLRGNHTHVMTATANARGRRFVRLINQGLEELLLSNKGLLLFKTRGYDQTHRQAWDQALAASLNR